MEMTIEAFADKAVKYAREVLMPKLTEPKNRHKLGAKIYFAKKAIMARFANPDFVGLVIDNEGKILVDELYASTMEGFKYADSVPFEGICNMSKEDAEEFFAYIKKGTV